MSTLIVSLETMQPSSDNVRKHRKSKPTVLWLWNTLNGQRIIVKHFLNRSTRWNLNGLVVEQILLATLHRFSDQKLDFASKILATLTFPNLSTISVILSIKGYDFSE